MNKMTAIEIVRYVSGTLNLSEREIMETLRIPLHPHELRDDFAGRAMQAAATNPIGADGFTFEQRAKWAYEQADAMLVARLRGTK